MMNLIGYTKWLVYEIKSTAVDVPSVKKGGAPAVERCFVAWVAKNEGPLRLELKEIGPPIQAALYHSKYKSAGYWRKKN